ncbi:MAG TPA: GNAT family protein [Puia sp.]|nr:GNAT family protein [Puia sp.]
MPNVFPYDVDATPPFLKGQTVFLQPAREEDRELIRPLARDPRLWEFTKTLLIDDSYDARFDAYFDEALRLPELDGRAFVIRTAGDGNVRKTGPEGNIARFPEKSNVCPSDNEPSARSGPGEIPLLRGSIIGMSRLFHVEWKDKRLEIGHTWYIPDVWGKVYNKECKLLLLQYAFEHLHLHRVEFRVAHQNIRSQRAVEKIGGIKEGVLRKFAIRNDGSRRDTVVFSIIDDEWPEKKERLQQMVQAAL